MGYLFWQDGLNIYKLVSRYAYINSYWQFGRTVIDQIEFLCQIVRFQTIHCKILHINVQVGCSGKMKYIQLIQVNVCTVWFPVGYVLVKINGLEDKFWCMSFPEKS